MADGPDLQHALFLRTFDEKLGFAPPNDPNADIKNVLDIGTGTGIWVIDFADEHPGAEVCWSCFQTFAILIGVGYWSRSVSHSAQFVCLRRSCCINKLTF